MGAGEIAGICNIELGRQEFLASREAQEAPHDKVLQGSERSSPSVDVNDTLPKIMTFVVH